MPAAVDANHIRLILNRPRLQQRKPVVFPHLRPVGEDAENLRSLPRRMAEHFREAQVITGKRRDLEASPGKQRDFMAAPVILRFLTG